MLQPEEIERYKRHLVLKEIGGAGQHKLKDARVLIVGAGGLGSAIALYLGAAGVGTIGLIDDDAVSLSNLQRQILHGTDDVGRAKVDSGRDALGQINPHVVVERHALRLNADNARDVIAKYDLVCDGSDNFETRYLVSDVCWDMGVTLIFGAVGPFDGYVSTFRPEAGKGEVRASPRYRDIFPQAPPDGAVANCAQVGVLGAVVGVIGTLQAVEAIKEITGAGESLAGRLLIYDALATRFSVITLSSDQSKSDI